MANAMKRSVLCAAALLSPASATIAKDIDCTAFPTGTWAGQSEMDISGQTYELHNVYIHNADGSFTTTNRYRTAGQDWTEQTVSGQWSAQPDPEEPNGCHITMSSEAELEGVSASFATSFTYIRIDENTLSSMNVEMKRQK